MSGSQTVFTRGENPLKADKLNQAISERVLRSGDTMTGPLLMFRDPVLPMEPVTLRYADNIYRKRTEALPFLPITGGTLTGSLTVTSDFINVTAPAGRWGFMSISRDNGQKAVFLGETNSIGRWAMVPGNADGEGGGNTGSNFALERYNDSGTLLDVPFFINRATGNVVIGPGVDGGYKLDVAGGGVRIALPSGPGNGLFIYKNVTTQVVPGGAVALMIQATDEAPANLQLYSFGTNPSSSIGFFRALGTAAAPLPVTVNQPLGGISGSGWNGSAYTNAANFVEVANENWSPTSTATRFLWQGVPTGQTARNTLMTLYGSGNLVISPTGGDAGYRLDVGGAASRFAATATTAPVIIQSIGGFDPSPNGYSTNTVLQINGITGNNGGITIDCNQGQAQFNGRCFQTGGIVANRNCMGIRPFGWDGAAYVGLGAIAFIAGEQWTPTAHGSYITFSVVPLGGAGAAEAMRIQPSGDVSIGYGVNPVDSFYRLDVNGTVRVSGSFITTSSVGFNGAAAPVKPNITGSRANTEQALFNLLAALTSYGLISNGTTA